MKFENLFNLDEARKTNMLVSGCNQIGKTRATCGIASMLHKLGYTVITIDVSGKHKTVSDLPFYTKPYRFNDSVELADFEPFASRIYDLSTLRLSEARKVVEAITLQIWDRRINLREPSPTWLIIEESEGYLRNIRGLASENIYRLVHVGANINVRAILVTTDLALLDASVIRLCQIRLHGKLGIEENAKRKFRAYYGKDYTKIATEGLGVGDFIRLQNNKLDVIHVPLFKARNNPKLWLHFDREQEPQQPQAQKPSLIQDLRKLKRKLF